MAVINDGGGQIFGRLPRLQTLSPRAGEWLTNPHAANLAGFATLWGMRHVAIRTPDDFDLLGEPCATATLLELVPDPNQTRQFWVAWDRLASSEG
ncbi:MAG: hypothetical protein DVB26_05295 [Verrucomicrobia bacterium]|nr:MAG: hypothetical protein DVB26_05295 [Verrucomicrobiota bacterium]